MRFLSLLITLLIIGFLANKQFNSDSPFITQADITGGKHSNIPEIPTSMKDVGRFKQEMNTYIDDTNQKRFDAIKDL